MDPSPLGRLTNTTGRVTIDRGAVGILTNAAHGAVTVRGGAVGSLVSSGAVTVTGGAIATLIGDATSPRTPYTICGGAIEALLAYNDAVFDIHGGRLGHGALRVFQRGALRLFGAELRLRRNAEGADRYGVYVRYILSGVLESGESVAGVPLFHYAGGVPLYVNGVAAT
jgi:hypothetical protein